jgi:crossover junction endodeoxyribonuclease RuvC
MLAIGIDPGTAITGYGLIKEERDGSLTIIDYGAIHTSSEMQMPDRLVELHQQLKQIINLHNPQSGAVEKLFFAKNVRTALTVGQARGVTLLALAEAGVPLFEYSPNEVKQSVTGYGGADKNQVQKMVQALLGLEEIPQPDDAADALAVAVCHLHNARLKELEERSKPN